MKGYLEIASGDIDKPSYIRENRINELRRISSIVFDCDGVLIDVAESYNRAVAETCSYITEAFTGIRLPRRLINEDIVFAFKSTGGFNNDWDLTYAIIMYILSRLSEDKLTKLNEIAEASLRFEDPYERFTYIENNVQQGNPSTPVGLKQGLLTYAEKLDETGVLSVDRNLLDKVGVSIKKALGHADILRKSIITSLFEQLFCGPRLFEKTFNIKPRFRTRGVGLVDKQRPIVTPQTLDQLASLLGGPKFGIASGSMATPARHVLGGLLGDLDPGAQVWMEDVEKAASERGRRDLIKPDPFSLRKASQALEPFTRVLYVGDTAADLLMAMRAREEDPRFLFAGVYYYVHPQEAVMKEFLAKRADIVIPSVNELPHLLEYVRGERN